MPSAEHETPIALAKLDPGLVAWLLANLFDVKVPDYHHARSQATDVRVVLRPLIFTQSDVPLVVDLDVARIHPALAVLSALCHAEQPEVDAAFPALAVALQALGPRKAILYYDIV